MALPDFTGQNIEDTYQRVLQTDGGDLRDGTGSLVTLTNITASGNISASGRVTANDYKIGSISFGSISSGETRLADGTQETTVFGTNIKLSAPVTASGDISASGTLFAGDINSGDISASGTLFADDIRATLPTGTDNSVVILDADGRLKTDEIDGDVFDTGKLAKSFANLDNFPTYNNQVAVWRDNTTLRGYTPITATSDGILIATVVSASSATASFIALLDVNKLRIDGVQVGERVGTDTKIGNTADTRTIIQSPKLEVTDLNIIRDITGSFDGGTF